MSAFYDKLLEYKKQGKVYVIAEVGSNWRTKEDLFGSISLAKACGADAVKFQFLTLSELYGPECKIDATFPLAQLKEKADAVGIDFLCSAFSPDGLKEVDKYVPAHKVASSEMAHMRLLEAVKKTGKPIILSTGAYFMPDIGRTLKFLEDHEVVVMHCNVKYPAKYSNLKKFEELKKARPIFGYSDHTTSIDVVPLFFKDRGVTVYEKHFNPFDFTDTPDAPHSLNTAEFKTMVSYMRDAPDDFDEEHEARLMYVRRLVALTDLMPGDILKEGVNVGIFRAQKPDARGASPFIMGKVVGKTVAREVRRGDGISLQDLA